MMGYPTIVTVFPGVSATSAKESQFEEIPALVRGAVGPLKNWLPMLKLARFGSAPNANGCLRDDANVVTITGIEADYDGEKLSFAEAVSLISCAWYISRDGPIGPFRVRLQQQDGPDVAPALGRHTRAIG
jgi:hypothetical protein